MINLLLIFIPGFLTFYRHGENFLKNIPPIILLEIVPYTVLCMIIGEPMFLALVSFLALSIFYEIGYVCNDTLSIKSEVENSTIRNTLAYKYVLIFILVRIIYFGLALFYIHKLNINKFENFIFISLVIIVIFAIHNVITGYFKVCTFISLNVLKIYFRILFITVFSNFYILAIFPHITIKLLHYLKTKKYITISGDSYKNLINPIYIGWLAFYIYISFDLFLFSLPFYINHIKKNVLDNIYKK